MTHTQLTHSTSKLSKIEEKLFFILYFFKNGHIQQSLAAQFEMNQGHVSRYIKVLHPLLLKSIKGSSVIFVEGEKTLFHLPL